jgi:hypothetical protein
MEWKPPRLPAYAQASRPTRSSAFPKRPRSRLGNRGVGVRVVLGVGVAVIVAMAVILIYSVGPSGPFSSHKSGVQTLVPAGASWSIPGQQYHSVGPWSVSGSSTIRGAASGTNYTTVLIVTSDEYPAFVNEQPSYTPYFDSGTYFSVSVLQSVAPGTYYLVFQNVEYSPSLTNVTVAFTVG